MQLPINDLPLRAELYNVEQLARHSKALANEHKSVIGTRNNTLLTRLEENEKSLLSFHLSMLEVCAESRVTPATEWLIDNFYLIEEQIQIARRHLPHGYSRELPRLVDGALAGLPRVYSIVLEMITHVDAQIDVKTLSDFIAAYQSIDPLKLGELWAIPIMLRLGLIENLKRTTTRLTIARRDCELANDWVDRLRLTAEKNPSNLVVVVAEMAKSNLPLTCSFVAEFCQLLSRHSTELSFARSWLEQMLGEAGLSAEQLIQQESQNQAADQVSVSHSISSLRQLSSIDWKKFVESLSEVETILYSDPAEIYLKMDFPTRDSYRHAVEKVARYGKYSETEVAQMAIRLADDGAKQMGKSHRFSHVGYYLVDKGYASLLREAKVTWPWQTAMERMVKHFPLTYYVGGVALVTVICTLSFLQLGMRYSLDGWKLTSLVLFFTICASQLGVAFMNWLSMLLVKPRLLPRMDFSEGLADECCTMVITPTLLTCADGVNQLIETLEIHYLSNKDPKLHFGLLTDYTDAPTESMPTDQKLLDQVRTGIDMLNQKYAPEKLDLFFLFQRPRRWNDREKVWMGYERKRGKLNDFNSLLRGESTDSFSEIIGSVNILSSIKYVITLDTDTQLPRDAAWRLIGTMAHPLNRPEFDSASQIVTEGYSILQPRIGVSLPSARRSWFVRIFAGDSGIDPYTRQVSDVYQDIFQEGTFIGKGIYDVDAFQRAVDGRFPENVILSHDLLEACYARSALVSDIELYEEYPSRYNVDIDRRHRWIRGDWQILQWLFPRVPGHDSQKVSNPLTTLSLWKIFDNLRRSLVPVMLMLLLLGILIFIPGNGSHGIILVVLLILTPTLLAIVFSLFQKSRELTWKFHINDVIKTSGQRLGQIFMTIAFLPYDAFISLDAIGKTLFRVWITRNKLLEWKTSGERERSKHQGLVDFYRTMWIAPVTAILVCIILSIYHLSQIYYALPILCSWIIAPSIAWWISQPITPQKLDLSIKQLGFLRRAARKTWYFFETFVTAQENWLPPDNFQEIPVPTIASRTSPTNMGIALLANVAAKDFGYISMGNLLQRTHDALSTMHDLPRYRGHFYNWYNTRTLEPLPPNYISSVDSGNLAGHLLTLSSGLRELADAKLFSSQIFMGLQDTVGVLMTLNPNHSDLINLEADLVQMPTDMNSAYSQLVLFDKKVAILADSMLGDHEELKGWIDILKKNCEDHLEDLTYVAPWLAQLHSSSDEKMIGILAKLNEGCTLHDIATLDEHDATEIDANLALASERARQRLLMIDSLSDQSDSLAAMDFAFLLDPSRKLFTVGFNVTDNRSDSSFYDLLASEARLCSYVAIALGQVSQEHWFSMGRLLVGAPKESLLVSWSGSMFEYLMPLLVMPTYENTLLDNTYRSAVQQQIDYGKLHSIPWGISESGYNRKDLHLNYQYRAFGVPGLGLKRGLSDDLVIAPYATAMALLVAPRAACENLQRLAKEGRVGEFGFYEAIDYTPSRLPPDRANVTIRSYMAHHQGMSLLAFVNLLHDYPMHRRFLNCPMLKAADLLLQERVPRTAVNVLVENSLPEAVRNFSTKDENVMRIFTDPAPSTPDVHLLSNGRYHVVITSAGGGYSRLGDLAITRWREDATRDCWGTFVYLRDIESGDFWSTAYQPTQQTVKGYEAIFTQARAEFRHHHRKLEVHTQVSVSPEDQIELRRITITNRSPLPRVIELTSYMEVVLASSAADAAHPAFSNLFVQTEFQKDMSAVLCTRRARSEEEKPPWLMQLLISQNEDIGEVSCETDRSRFVGRGGNLANPAAMQHTHALSNTVGSVLDPIVSLRRTVTIAPHGVAIIDLVNGVSENRHDAVALIEKYQSPHMAERTLDLAWTHNQVILHQLNATESEAQLYGRLAGLLIYASPARRAHSSILTQNRRSQNGLWSYGISGDVPIIFLHISDLEKIELVKQLVRAHAYWRMKGLIVDLIILHDDVSGYRQTLQDRITSLVTAGNEVLQLDKPGGIFVRHLDQISDEDRNLLLSSARVVLDDRKGTLAEQLEHQKNYRLPVSSLTPTRADHMGPLVPLIPRELIFANGYGGFTRDGHEYVITLESGQMTPAPWVNVLANRDFGTVVSESGSAYTWFENSHEYRITPWNNDPVQDPTGEAFYIRDEETGQFWSPTPLPARGLTPYVIRHGFGYTVFEHTENGIVSELWVYVAMDAAVKFTVLKIRNASGRSRRISVTGYYEWVLGELRHKSLMHVQTEVDIRTGALLVYNYGNNEFQNRIVFLDVNDSNRTYTGDRKEFIGRNGNLSQPAAMKRKRLSGRVGAGLDPCGAMQVSFELTNGQERETSFRLGAGRNLREVQDLIYACRQTDASRTALEGVWSYWNRTLGAINIDTPDSAVNVMANGWLLYQTLSCRIWGRTGFYQSGGAYGFRDQLQDVMALVHAEPTITREHLLLAASRQFREGDVQHWWHPPVGRGVRTHFTDDYLWLPYVTCHYVSCVADYGVLDIAVPFLESRPLRADEEANYDLPNSSGESATLYQHCVRSIEKGMSYGVHGLPLMGGGDWNDGMNCVGKDGKGESVWLAFFYYDVLTRFSKLARTHGDQNFAERCLSEARQLQENIEKHTWDGKWYRRAYFDDGEPLGSQLNQECQIDSLPQSWSIISGAGESSRSQEAMKSVEQRLIRRDAGLIQLFDPPFDKSSLNPGYIKGYIPGVRENGGQYTHGAIWTTMAFALMGENEKAWELFSLLNPIHHGATRDKIETYKVEPYVVAADVYAVAPHVGRGGWTWYTGSAGWMYRLLIETLLGIHLEGSQLRLDPKMPKSWPSFKIHYRYRQTVYHITILRHIGSAVLPNVITVDGLDITGTTLSLIDDQIEHTVEMKVS